MKYLLPSLGAIALVFNMHHAAQAQQDLTILRASSIGQGAHETFHMTYQHAIKYARQATATSGFAIQSAERVHPDRYMMLGRKPVANSPYGEIIRVLVIRKSESSSEIRILIRQEASARANHERRYADEIYADIQATMARVSV